MKRKKPEKPPPSPNLVTGHPIGTERARELAAMRRTHGRGPGRPRSKKLRCACGKMTLTRALTRGHDCENYGDS